MAAGTIPASFSGLKKTDSLPGCLQKSHARKGFGMPKFQNEMSSSVRIRFARVRNSSSDVAEMQQASEGSPLLVPKQRYWNPYTRQYAEKKSTMMVGNVPLGSEHPIRVQTMTTTDTKDVLGTIEQVLEGEAIAGRFVQLTEELDQALDGLAYNQVKVSDEVPEQILILADAFAFNFGIHT